MSMDSVVMMFLMCSFVWGGFILLLVRAVRCEGSKS
jgi:hypothetical protein